MYEMIERQQLKGMEPGYGRFTSDLYDNIKQPRGLVSPRPGAPFLSMKYQNLDKMDYVIVPKLSKVDPNYRDFSDDHNYLDIGQDAIAESLPTDNIGHRKYSVDFVSERISLSMLTSFQFNADTIQLLYLPVRGRFIHFGYHNVTEYNGKNLGEEPKDEGIVRIEQTGTFMSEKVKITSNDLLKHGYNDAAIPELQRFSEKVFIEKSSESIPEDSEEDCTPFAPNTPLEMRSVSLRQWGSLISEWILPVFDIFENSVVMKTLQQWHLECEIDNLAIMPIERADQLLYKGFTPEQILYLSPRVTDATTDEDFKTIYEEFIEEELSLR
ncbi:MAG: hypothetical protein PVI43_00355 [Candidatus Bathyarchaeota archaeon]